MHTLLSLLLASASIALAQPVVTTNVVRLSSATRLAWDAPEPGLQGYTVLMEQGTARWAVFTTNTFVPVLTLNSNAQTGTYLFTVRAVNKNGLAGDPATLSTNFSKLPAVVVNLRLEVTLE